jgi:hypothetical protein
MPPRETVARQARQKMGPWPLGIDEKTSPDSLKRGRCADAQNLLLDEKPNKHVKRNGSRSLSVMPSGSTPRDGYDFKKSDGTEYVLASDGGNLYYSVDPSSSWTSLKTGLSSDAFMEFETAEDKVWMSNGVDAVMSWDGTTLVTYDRTYTSTTNLTTVDSTHITHAGLASSTDYWKNMKLVFTVGANVGTVVTVTAYNDSTNTLTFTPAVAGIAATDRFSIGLNLPKGKYLRFWNDNLFLGNTTDNNSELRFNRRADPNTGNYVNLDNPQAWPATYQLNIYAQDGDQIWGLSPILRDRFLIHKASGFFRLERDSLTIYRIEVVSREIGSRFHRSWAEKNSLLYFIGQTRDGYPDVFKTDMVDIGLVDPDGGLEPTLRSLRQPNSIQRSVTLTSQTDFDAGTKSTLAQSSSGALQNAGVIPTLFSNSNIDPLKSDGTSGYNGLLGIPTWDIRYEADALPDADTHPWVRSTSGGSLSIAAGILSVVGSGTLNPCVWRRSNELSATKNAIITIKAKARTATTGNAMTIGLFNGSKCAYVALMYNAGKLAYISGKSSSGIAITWDMTAYHVYTLQLTSDGNFKFWVDGVLFSSGAGVTTTRNEVLAGTSYPATTTSAPNVSSGNPNWFTGSGTVDIDYHYYSADSTAAPDTILLTGEFVVQIDYTRTPDALLRYYLGMTAHGATVTLSSWSASASDFASGTDPSGYIAFTNGNQPTSQIKRYLRIKVSITAADYSNAPDITSFYGGMLWTSAAIFVGPNISAWRSFLATLTKPASTDQTIKIRRATISTTPGESDWGSWFTIVNADNIGTILSDATPPASRWAQLKIEQGPSSAGASPSVDAMSVQWSEGSSAVLPLFGVMHKKRYMFCAASATSSTNDKVLVYDRNDAPMKYSGWNVNAMIHFKGMLLGLSSVDSKILQLDVDDVYNDQGTAIDAFLDSQDETFENDYELRKNLRYGYVHVGSTTAFSLTASYKRPGDSSFTGSVTLTADGTGRELRQNFPIGTVCKRLQRRYRNAVLDQDMELLGETIYYDRRPGTPS